MEKRKEKEQDVEWDCCHALTIDCLVYEAGRMQHDNALTDWLQVVSQRGSLIFQ